MKSRGRKSAAELMVGPVVINRLEPPYALTDQEVVIWRMVVNSASADHFAASHIPLLTQLCRHVVASDRVGMLIEQLCKARKLATAELQSLLATQSAESSHATPNPLEDCTVSIVKIGAPNPSLLKMQNRVDGGWFVAIINADGCYSGLNIRGRAESVH